MYGHNDAHAWAADCLRKAQDTENVTDKRSWLIMAESWIMLSNFRDSAAAQDLAAAEKPATA
jgi:hypothetical protein